MNIVTQYLEANCITLSESDNEKLYDIVKWQLIIPGEDVTTNTVLKSSLQTVVLLIIPKTSKIMIDKSFSNTIVHF